MTISVVGEKPPWTSLRNDCLVAYNDVTDERYLVVSCSCAQPASGGRCCVLFDEAARDRLAHWRSISVDDRGYTSRHREILPLDVDEQALTRDHIDRVRVDNRSKNLRPATRALQNQNTGFRSDRPEGAYAALCAQLGLADYGIRDLPRFFRWDNREQKFSFKDHPVVKIAWAHGVDVNCSGSKSAAASPLNKFRSALLRILRAFDHVQEAGLDVSDADDEQRVSLASEYNDAVRAAHLYAPDRFPDGPYANLRSLKNCAQRDTALYRHLLEKLPPLQPGEAMDGPVNLPAYMHYVPELDVVVCYKGPGNPFVWDAKHHHVMGDVTIDPGDGRIHLSPELRARLGLEDWPGTRIHATQLVYHVLEGHPVVPGFTVVPFATVRKDLRSVNLAHVRGQGSNFQSRAMSPEQLRPFVDIGYEFYPRGVSVSIAHSQRSRNPPDVFTFVINPSSSFLPTNENETRDSKKRRHTAHAGTARRDFETTVLPLLLRINPRFHEFNAKYQRLLSEYLYAWELTS